MADLEQSLTGKWIGRYTYDMGGPVCSFDAWLDDRGGTLTGETVEPNTFEDTAGDTLMAALAGDRTGQAVSFTKKYTDLDIERVAYAGEIDLAFRRITGTWHIIGQSWFRGKFSMSRAPMVGRARIREMEAT